MDAITEQTTTRVVGLIFPLGKREAVEYSCLRELYQRFKIKAFDGLFDRLPYYLVFADGTIVPYVHQMFYWAFTLERYPESELREMLEFSGI